MKTVNISLTENQTQAIDQAVNQFGFANRSEFFRALIRTFLNKPDLISVPDWPMKSPKTKSAKEVLEGFQNTGKYSPEFLHDLKEGLKDSDFFIDDFTTK